MPTASAQPELAILQRIRSLALFNDEQLGALAAKLTINIARPKQRIISRGDTGNYSLYLLSGMASSRDANGQVAALENEAGAYLQAVAQLRPSLYDIDAISCVEYLKIDSGELSGFSQSLESDHGVIEVTAIDQSEAANRLTIQLCQDMAAGGISLPTMPDIVFKIQQAFADKNNDAARIRDLIQSDPAIAARLLRTANSPLYRGSSPVDSLQQAIVRLGMQTVRNQIMIFAASQLFEEKSAAIKSRLQALWKSSRRLSAFSRVLAQKLSQFDTETAQLAGLLSDLGVVAILQAAQQHGELFADEEAVDLTIRNMRPLINGMLLQKWNMSDELITVGEESHDWFRNHADQADLCDLVLVARYFSYFGSAQQSQLPLLSKMPAFAKLKLSDFAPRDSIAFIRQTQQEIDEIEQMLGAG